MTALVAFKVASIAAFLCPVETHAGPREELARFHKHREDALQFGLPDCLSLKGDPLSVSCAEYRLVNERECWLLDMMR